ncbi:hypothetical protein TM_0003 [Thermotoga maritima MSB8]|uniref:Uncharacterized protein n=1 Tax=Thermotoga maritima (strain ATCC 43589 / DSM 3109 / JCM 10099 / NBRC 100826 / MSB8) TaxID=243274 RepID=Q9WXL8_THEMA|nr:hypothetical protein TM_0003 [Thermotoga maritima MSB8]
METVKAYEVEDIPAIGFNNSLEVWKLFPASSSRSTSSSFQ